MYAAQGFFLICLWKPLKPVVSEKAPESPRCLGCFITLFHVAMIRSNRCALLIRLLLYPCVNHETCFLPGLWLFRLCDMTPATMHSAEYCEFGQVATAGHLGASRSMKTVTLKTAVNYIFQRYHCEYIDKKEIKMHLRLLLRDLPKLLTWWY